MTLYNVTMAEPSHAGTSPAKVRLVQNPTGSSVTAPAFAPGEPVGWTLGGPYVIQLVTAAPVIGTTFVAGIAEDYSTESGANDGIVHVSPIDPNTVYLCNANSAVDISTQAKYNALVGKRVTFSKSAANNTGIFTVLGTDGSTYGLVIENSDIIANPGKIAFSFRVGTLYNY